MNQILIVFLINSGSAIYKVKVSIYFISARVAEWYRQPQHLGKDQRSIPGSDGKRWNIGNNSAGEGVSYTTAGLYRKKIETMISFVASLPGFVIFFLNFISYI